MENIELRWLDTGKTTVLQYRMQRLREQYSVMTVADFSEIYCQSEWSDWHTVPTFFKETANDHA